MLKLGYILLDTGLDSTGLDTKLYSSGCEDRWPGMMPQPPQLGAV